MPDPPRYRGLHMNPIGRLFIRLHTFLLRASKGQKFNMGGRVLLLTTTGAKTGKKRTNPLMYLTLDDGSYAVAASAAGAPKSPAWFHNLSKNPNVELEVDGRRIQALAEVTEGAQRDELYEKFKQSEPRFAGYEAKTDRVIPVVVLVPS